METTDDRVLSTGIPELDEILGIGGLPEGRVIELFGRERDLLTIRGIVWSLVKTTQASGGVVAIVDVEHAIDPIRAQDLGVSLDKLLVSQPDSGEQALEIAEQLVRSGAVNLVIVDSVRNLVHSAEIDGSVDDLAGLGARLMSQALRKITAVASRSGTTVVFLNSTRERVSTTFGPSEVTSGGNALKFYASVRIQVSGTVTAKIVKNKLAAPFRSTTFAREAGELPQQGEKA